jgi:4-amino-4-deoxy-L-arabinose transferase-like glycosyltransferase
MQASIDYGLQNKQDARLRVDLELGLLVTLLGLILFLRITNTLYNTLFVDEAIYVTGGRDLLAGLNDRHILAWFGGSFIYPTVSALAANLAGDVGVRLLSALLTTVTAIFVYLTTRKLFNRQVALWAILIFGLSGGSISLGQLAVYDVLMLPFLAVALFCLVTATRLDRRAAWAYLLFGALAYSAAALAKYTAIFYLPALCLTATALYIIRRRWRGIVSLIIFFVVPVLLILGAYILTYYQDVIQVFTGQQGFQAASPLAVASNISDEIGVATLVALLGLFAVILSAWRDSLATPATVVTTLSGYFRPKHKGRLVFVTGAALILFASFLSLPLYQILTSNIRSVWKATYASLIFLAPLAGYMLAKAIERIQQLKRARLVATALVTLLVVSWISYDLDRNWGFQNSWPNVSGAIDYLRQHGLTKDSHVLAEGGAIYEYYFYSDFGLDGRHIWTDTWFMDYKGLQGTQAMTAAIADHYFNFVVLDDNYTPDVNPHIDEALSQAGYVTDYRNVQLITTGHTSVVRVYTKP